MQESTNECINKWNNTSVAFFLSPPPSFLKSIFLTQTKKKRHICLRRKKFRAYKSRITKAGRPKNLVIGPEAGISSQKPYLLHMLVEQ